MRRLLPAVAMAAGVLALPGASQEPAPGLAERYDFSTRTARYDLPGRLDEASGLAMTADGRLFTHNDERGNIYQVDVRSGALSKQFSVGRPDDIRGDFEGLAVAGDRFFITTSEGLLYEFRETPDGGRSPARASDTRLAYRCEVEGLAYDPTTEDLLMACKEVFPASPYAVIYRIPLDPRRHPAPPILVALNQLPNHGARPELNLSGVAVDPEAGTLLLVAASQHLLVEVDRDGAVHSAIRLRERWHPQPEGVELGPDGRLYIADEKGGGKDARVTVYAPDSGGSR